MISAYLADRLIECLFKDGTALANLPNLYVGLFTTMPDCCSNGTEVTASGNYARVAVAAANWSQNPANGPSVQNNANVTFNTANGSWGTAIGIGLFDASTSGNLLFAGALRPATLITTGSPPLNLMAGQIILDLCGCSC